jgi:YVTN family beta-propeller protein
VLILGLSAASALPVRAAIDTLPGMPPVVNPQNLYSETGADRVSPEIANDLPRVYVPSLGADRVYVIDPQQRVVIDSFPVGTDPQHIVPSWDLKTLWVTNNGRRGTEGSLTPIDPKTGKPGAPIRVADPYNLYFTPDGKSAIVVAERLRRLDFRDPHTMAFQYSIPTPLCAGVNHAD